MKGCILSLTLLHTQVLPVLHECIIFNNVIAGDWDLYLPVYLCFMHALYVSVIVSAWGFMIILALHACIIFNNYIDCGWDLYLYLCFMHALYMSVYAYICVACMHCIQ